MNASMAACDLFFIIATFMC